MGFFQNLFKKKRKILMVNDQLTIIFPSGTTLVLNNATKAQYKHLEDLINDSCFSDEDIADTYYELLDEVKKTATPLSEIIAKKEEEKKEVKKQEAIVKEKIETAVLVKAEVENKFASLVASGDFTEKNGSLYMNGIPLSIPSLLVEKFTKLIKKVNDNDADALDQYCAHKNFWLWTSLCPNKESREDLYTWIEQNDLKINKNGFFFAYRKVDKVNDWKETIPTLETKLSEYVTNQFLKVKSWKKSPKNFTVCRGIEEFSCILTSNLNGDEVQMGNLFDLYTEVVSYKKEKNIPVQIYTDNYTHSMIIEVGKEVSLSPEQCNWDNLQSCANGLHIRNKVNHGCGDTSIVVLVNPMNVVAVPQHDNTKMRVRAYYVVAAIEDQEDAKILDNLDTLDLADNYLADQVKNLNKMVLENKPEEAIQHKYMANFSKEELKIITKQAVDIKKVISERTIKA